MPFMRSRPHIRELVTAWVRPVVADRSNVEGDFRATGAAGSHPAQPQRFCELVVVGIVSGLSGAPPTASSEG